MLQLYCDGQMENVPERPSLYCDGGNAGRRRACEPARRETGGRSEHCPIKQCVAHKQTRESKDRQKRGREDNARYIFAETSLTLLKTAVLDMLLSLLVSFISTIDAQ